MGGAAQADTLTPDIIWGDGNTNRGFTVVSDGTLELGLRAKLRYPSPNDALGVGIVQDGSGAYVFSSGGEPSGSSIFNFDWGINTNVDGNGADISSSGYYFVIGVDTDPTVANNFAIAYDPFGVDGSGYYVGDNNTANGLKKFSNGDFLFPGNETDTFGDNLGNSNVAQNSVQPQWVGGVTGSGQFTFTLSAFDENTEELVSSVSIDVIVDAAAPVPLPAGFPLVLGGVGALYVMKRRKRNA